MITGKYVTTIALVEFRQHNEVLESLLRQTRAQGLSVSVFTTAFCFSSSSWRGDTAVTWHVCQSDTALGPFLELNESLINSHSHVIFITPLDELIDLAQSCPNGTKHFCIVHNHNNFFVSPRPIFEHMRRFRSPTLLMPDSCLVREHDPWRSTALNIAFPDHLPTKRTSATVVCTIPGRVYEGRRYDDVFSILPDVSKRLRRSLTLNLLGEVKSLALIDTIRELQSSLRPYVDLRSYDGFVAQEEYDSVLAKTDFLLLPLERRILHNGLPETRGETCVSGGVNDMVRFGLPAILPDFYPLNEHLEALVQRYDTLASMASLVVEWVNNRTFNREALIQEQLEKYKEHSLRVLRQALGLKG